MDVCAFHQKKWSVHRPEPNLQHIMPNHHHGTMADDRQRRCRRRRRCRHCFFHCLTNIFLLVDMLCDASLFETRSTQQAATRQGKAHNSTLPIETNHLKHLKRNHGPYQADRPQVHRRQGSSQAARHQGRSQVGPDHRRRQEAPPLPPGYRRPP